MWDLVGGGVFSLGVSFDGWRLAGFGGVGCVGEEM